MYAPLIKYGIILATTIGIIYFFYDYSYDRGVTHERNKWELTESKRQQATAVVLEKNATEAERRNTKLMEIVAEKNQLTDDLRTANERISTKRLYIESKSAVCNNRVSQAKNSSQFSRRAGSVELSTTLARKIREDYRLAQEVVIQYNACRAELKNIAEVIK